MQTWRNRWLAFVAFGGFAFAGCPSPEQPAASTDKTDQPSRTSVTLGLVVVNDPPLADAIGRLRGEWAERSGGAFTVAAVTLQQLTEENTPSADVVVFPSRYLGELFEANQLRPVRENVLTNESLNFQDVFPLIRQQLVSYNKQVMALPLSIDFPLMSFRSVDGVPSKPPASWEEYLKTYVSRSNDVHGERKDGVWEPVRSWGAALLLARVASYAHSDTPAFFDPETMRPRIAGEPFVRALTELRAAALSMRIEDEASSDRDRTKQDPHSAAMKIAAGQVAVAIGLPSAARFQDGDVRREAALQNQVHWAALPGANEVYNSTAGSWDKLDSPRRVPLLGINDRLAAVTTTSRNAATAFQFLAWLASSEVSGQFANAGGSSLPVRKALADSPQWFDSQLSTSERTELANVLKSALSGGQCLLIPRIPGIDEYLLFLGEAVEDAVFEGAEPKAALEKAAAGWELLTERHGREKQRIAYLRHLGIASP